MFIFKENITMYLPRRHPRQLSDGRFTAQRSVSKPTQSHDPVGLSKESMRPVGKQRLKLLSEWPIAGGNPVRIIIWHLVLYGVDDDD
jgi:hypothetical protein